MRTSKILTAVNWRHAFGEVFLIVVGILIALAISDWNDRRIERQQELALLAEIRSTLHTDVAALESKLDETLAGYDEITQLRALLEDPPPYESELDGLFGSAYGLRKTNLSAAAYETLKSVGLQMVSNRELRVLIARVFDYHYQRLDGVNIIEHEVIMNVMRPYYLQHFLDLRINQSATPINYSAIVNDPYFKNLIHYRLTVLEYNQLTFYPEAIADMRRAIAMIDEEINR